MKIHRETLQEHNSGKHTNSISEEGMRHANEPQVKEASLMHIISEHEPEHGEYGHKHVVHKYGEEK